MGHFTGPQGQGHFVKMAWLTFGEKNWDLSTGSLLYPAPKQTALISKARHKHQQPLYNPVSSPEDTEPKLHEHPVGIQTTVCVL